MVIVNVEGAIRKDNESIIIERSKKEEHVGRLLSLRKCKTQTKKESSTFYVTGSVDGEKTQYIWDIDSHMNWCPYFRCYISISDNITL